MATTESHLFLGLRMALFQKNKFKRGAALKSRATKITPRNQHKTTDPITKRQFRITILDPDENNASVKPKINETPLSTARNHFPRRVFPQKFGEF